MIFTVHINDEEINRVAGELAGKLALTDFKEHPQWFVENADLIEVAGSFGKYQE